jgi:SAM-dependent methyltransferase
MEDEGIEQWFQSNKDLLESAYLKGTQAWQQSGFGLRSERTYEMWEVQRRPVADCMEKSGNFLDIGCANGYLLECVMRWTGERGIEIVPYGLDLSEKLCQLARERLPQYANHIFVGNVWDWIPPRRFDYVRTELEYVPLELHSRFVSRLLDLFLEADGKLLVAEYRAGRSDTRPELSIDAYLRRLGFKVLDVKSGYRDRIEQTRVATVAKD